MTKDKEPKEILSFSCGVQVCACRERYQCLSFFENRGLLHRLTAFQIHNLKNRPLLQELCYGLKETPSRSSEMTPIKLRHESK